jgi:hypothetical protein
MKGGYLEERRDEGRRFDERRDEGRRSEERRAGNLGTGVLSLSRAVWGGNLALPALGGPTGGAVRIGRPAMAQLARAAGWGSLIWVVNDFPNGYGALTGRPGRAASVRRPGGFSGVSPERPRARVAAAIAHLGRAEGTGRSVRTPCAFPWPEGAVTAPPWIAVVKKGR